jgi:hypothetical protein
MATSISTSTGIPVVAALECERPRANLNCAMKTLKRLAFGVLSSLLFAVGLARAGDHLDPISRSLTAADKGRVLASAPDTADICEVVDDVR